MKTLLAPYVSAGSFRSREEMDRFMQSVPADFPKKLAVMVPAGAAALGGRAQEREAYPRLSQVGRMPPRDPRMLVMADMGLLRADSRDGTYAPKLDMCRAIEAAGGGLDAIVLGELWPDPMNLITFRLLKDSCPVVLRIGARALCNVRWPMRALCARLGNYAEVVDCVVFEAGEGRLIKGLGDFAEYADLLEELAACGMRIGISHTLQEDMGVLEAFGERFPEGCVEFILPSLPGDSGRREALRARILALVAGLGGSFPIADAV